MGRIKISLPQNLLATISIPVRINDINYGNHVGNTAIVDIIHEARVQFLNIHHFTELNVAGVSLIMNEILVEYRSESFYGDFLMVNIFAGEISKVGFELYYSITTTRNEKTILIAHAKTGMVCYDYHAKKIMILPNELKAIMLH